LRSVRLSVRWPVRWLCLWTWLTVFLSSRTMAAELAVGPGKAHARIEEALVVAKSGDVIVVHPQVGDGPYERVALSVNRPGLTIKAAGILPARIRLSGMGGDYSGRGPVPRAIVQFNKGADHCVLEGFELLGAHNESHNAAGVRINQANNVTIRSCCIHNNDMGIMSNGDGTQDTAVNQLIENCLIYRNGDPLDPGYNHNLYLGGATVTLLGCEVHSSLTGHNVKSRAHRTLVFACYVHDSANREFDLVDGKGDTARSGSDAVLAGNIIVKDANCSGNRAVIHFGQDGGYEHEGTLFLIHNTIVTPFTSPVVHLSAPKARARLYNNIIWDGGKGQNGQVLVHAGRDTTTLPVEGKCNWMSFGFKDSVLESIPLQHTLVGGPGAVITFVNPAKGDYRLAKPDPQVLELGCTVPADAVQALNGRLLQYKAPQASEPRVIRGKPDLGAIEWGQMTKTEPTSAGHVPKAAPER